MQRVRDDERAQWQQWAYQSPPLAAFTERSAGAFVPTGNRSQYFIVWLIEPIETNVVALGYDIGSDTATRLPAIQSALATHRATVTSRLRLVQSTTTEWGLLYLQPLKVYQTLAYQRACMNYTYTLDPLVRAQPQPSNTPPSRHATSVAWMKR